MCRSPSCKSDRRLFLVHPDEICLFHQPSFHPANIRQCRVIDALCKIVYTLGAYPGKHSFCVDRTAHAQKFEAALVAILSIARFHALASNVLADILLRLLSCRLRHRHHDTLRLPLSSLFKFADRVQCRRSLQTNPILVNLSM